MATSSSSDGGSLTAGNKLEHVELVVYVVFVN